jgi:hypothetical protein
MDDEGLIKKIVDAFNHKVRGPFLDWDKDTILRLIQKGKLSGEAFSFHDPGNGPWICFLNPDIDPISRHA